jgi:hypothetical protein
LSICSAVTPIKKTLAEEDVWGEFAGDSTGTGLVTEQKVRPVLAVGLCRERRNPYSSLNTEGLPGESEVRSRAQARRAREMVEEGKEEGEEKERFCGYGATVEVILT